jgi:hypothetical protein
MSGSIYNFPIKSGSCFNVHLSSLPTTLADATNYYLGCQAGVALPTTQVNTVKGFVKYESWLRSVYIGWRAIPANLLTDKREILTTPLSQRYASNNAWHGWAEHDFLVPKESLVLIHIAPVTWVNNPANINFWADLLFEIAR